MGPRQRGDLLGVVGDEGGLPQPPLHELLEHLGDDLARTPAVTGCYPEVMGSPPHLLQGEVVAKLDTGVLHDQVQVARPAVGRGQVEGSSLVGDLGATGYRGDHFRDHRFHQLHHVDVVGERLVGLQHGEFGVVGGVHSLVAEVAVDLEHPLHPAHHEPLQVQLRGDPQVHVDAQRVVVGGEGSRKRAARLYLQHGGLHLHEAAPLEGGAQGLHHRYPDGSNPPCLLVDDQVQVPLAVTTLLVLKPVPLLRKRPQRLGEQDQLLDSNTQLTPPGCDDLTGGADPVAPVDVLEGGEGARPQVPGVHEELDAAGAVLQDREDELAHPAEIHDPTGYRHDQPGLGTRFQITVLLGNLGGGDRALETHRIGIDTVPSQGLHLGEATGGEWMGGEGLGVGNLAVGHGCSTLPVGLVEEAQALEGDELVHDLDGATVLDDHTGEPARGHRPGVGTQLRTDPVDDAVHIPCMTVEKSGLDGFDGSLADHRAGWLQLDPA